MTTLPNRPRSRLADVDESVAESVTREDYLKAALERNPEFQAAKETESKAGSAVQAAPFEYIPNVGAYARHTFQTGVPFVSHSFVTFGLQMTWDIFDWGKRKGVVGERQEQWTEAHENIKRITERLTVDIEKAWRRLERTRMMVEVAREALALRQESQRITGNQVKAEVSSDAKQAEAVAATRSAEADELQARLAYDLALAEMASVAGMTVR